MTASNAAVITDLLVDLSAVGIDTVPTKEAQAYLERSNPLVLGITCNPGHFQSFIQLILKEKRKNPHKQFIIICEDLSTSQMSELVSLVRPAKLLFTTEMDQLEVFFQQGFQQYYELEQGEQLAQLVNEKNDELKRLTIQLEEKVEDRQSQLENSKARNIEAEKRLTVLKKTLMQIYKADSISEIEHGITEALKKEFDISWVRLRRPSQSNLEKPRKDLNSFQVSLKSGKRDFGFLIFFRDNKKSFSKEEKKFFSQVADAVSLSIERTFQNQRSQELKRQWEATFDAISDPICLTDSQYNILRVNKSFIEKIGVDDYHKVLGEKCYKALFNQDSICHGCKRGELFQMKAQRTKTSSEIYDVYSNTLVENQTVTFFQMYREVTQDLNFQRQIIESAKMAELGTISSSIAHELNNPIGGMLNFVQLMKMDLDGKEDYYDDIVEIEKGIQKCKNIVKNLLGFSRKSDPNKMEPINLIEVIKQAVKITELKTSSIGIKISFSSHINEMIIPGRFNLLAHSIRNILQNSQESILEKRSQILGYQGLIEIQTSQTEEAFFITISDDGLGLEKKNLSKIFDPLFTTKDPETNSGLGLTLALQIVEEHKGKIEVSINKNKKISFTLSFFKSEVETKQ